jgi:glycosyltransferase involved in cell wall biosynthesis
MSARESQPPEALAIISALAKKLDRAELVLVGCRATPLLQGVRDDLRLVSVDRPDELDDRKLGETLLAISARSFLDPGFAGGRLRSLVDEVRAAAVVDTDGSLGLEAAGQLADVAHDAGLRVDHLTLVRGPDPDSRLRDSPLLVVSAGTDTQIRDLLAAGARGLALDPDVDREATLDRPLRVCIASYEVVGPTRNGGIGTANTSLAQALARAGHDVTLLFTGQLELHSEEVTLRWRERYAREHVRFETLDQSPAASVRLPHYNPRRAYELYRWLLAREPFDVVHFPECQGHGYYAVLARRQRRAFPNTVFIAGIHSSTRWCFEANRELMRSIDALVDDHLERRSVELADVVISPSAYMLDYMEERCWKLPRRRFVQQYIVPPTARTRPRPATQAPAPPPDEVIFFGRLEVRKGIEAFCDALDQLALEAARELKITFLGRPEHVFGEPSVDYLARRSRRWPWRYEIVSDLDQPGAMSYLRAHNCLVVVPSTVDNSPNTVIEALGLGLPIVTSRAGGTGELIDPLDLARCTFPGLEPPTSLPPPPAGQPTGEVSAEDLAARIRDALTPGAVAPRLAVDPDASERAHLAWHIGAVVAQRTLDAENPAPEPLSLPSVSVGVLHRDDPDGLVASLAGVVEQHDELLDVIVVDDGSRDPNAMERLDGALRLAPADVVTILRHPAPHAARAYEAIVSLGRGDLLVLLPSGARLRPHALRQLRELVRDGAEILTWAALGHTDDMESIVVPLDGPALLGLIYPAFAVAGFAITRRAFARLGGFATDARGSDAVQDLLNRALLAGLRFELVPYPLTTVQSNDRWTEVRSAPSVEVACYAQPREEQLLVARAFREASAGELADLPGLYQTLLQRTALEYFGTESQERRRQAEYIAYLEHEHHQLSATIHAFQARLAAQPYRQQLRRTLGRVKRRLLA